MRVERENEMIFFWPTLFVCESTCVLGGVVVFLSVGHHGETSREDRSAGRESTIPELAVWFALFSSC